MTDDKKPPEKDQNSNEKKRTKAFYIRLIIIYAVCVLLLILVINYDSFANTINKFASVLMPILYGFIIAYLCNPLYNLLFDKILFKLKSVRWRKILSLVLTYVVVILLIFAMLFVLIQQLIISIQDFLANIDGYIKGAEDFIFDIIDHLGFIKSEDEIADGVNSSFSFTKEDIINAINNFLDNSRDWFIKVGNDIITLSANTAITVFNIFLGFIFSVYILTERDMLCAKAKKLTKALFKPDRADRYILLANYSNNKIGHFIKGKLLESFIVGIMAYVLFLIFRIPNALMIAMIVSIMNMIPFFGPFLGAIPAALLVLIMDPSKTIAYIIIVIIIMQINGNYISPKIVGSRTGLTPFGAMTALVLMSGYFGVIGMFIGIPICAIVVELLWREMNSRLEERGLSDNLDDYYSPKALAILNEERSHPSHHRNLTAIVVDEIVLIFNMIFRRRKYKEEKEKKKSEAERIKQKNNEQDKSC